VSGSLYYQYVQVLYINITNNYIANPKMPDYLQSTQTHAQHYNLQFKHQVHTGYTLDEFYAHNWLPSDLVDGISSKYLKNYYNARKKGKFARMDEKALTGWLTTWLRGICKSITKEIRVLNTSNNDYLDGNKPDISVLPNHLAPHPRTVLFCFEVKLKNPHLPESMMQIIDYLMIMLKAQPSLNDVIGALITSTTLIILHMEPGFNTPIYACTCELMPEDWKPNDVTPPPLIALQQIFSRAASSNSVNNNLIKICQHLGVNEMEHIGYGSTSIVYKANVNGNLVAVKVFKSNVLQEDIDKEVSILQQLHFPNILQLVEAGQRWITLQPLCITSCLLCPDKFEKHQWIEALMALKYLHEQGLVHCDIRPENIMLDGSGKLQLLDVGSVVKKVKY